MSQTTTTTNEGMINAKNSIEPESDKAIIGDIRDLFIGYEGEYPLKEIDWGTSVGREIW